MDVARFARNNLVLQYIPHENFSKLIPHMHIQEVDGKEVLHQAGEPFGSSTFPSRPSSFGQSPGAYPSKSSL